MAVFTVYIEGNLFRIAGEHADAIGQEVTAPPELPPNASDEDVKKVAWDQMRTCYDPEIPINIVELGLIYDCEVNPNEDGTRTVGVKMTLTAPGCGMGEVLVADVKEKIERIPTVRVADVRTRIRSAVGSFYDVGSRTTADRDVLKSCPSGLMSALLRASPIQPADDRSGWLSHRGRPVRRRFLRGRRPLHPRRRKPRGRRSGSLRNHLPPPRRALQPAHRRCAHATGLRADPHVQGARREGRLLVEQP